MGYHDSNFLLFSIPYSFFPIDVPVPYLTSFQGRNVLHHAVLSDDAETVSESAGNGDGGYQARETEGN
jgi:hypothetical protein